ncbi:hypothetical protein [Paenibacillus sp. TSA_86.1]|uniref:hypothetical protein n=1 Tax=Paenibacillus sp. TSA_86.1 TaxID=3415649 RepID=UPI0040458DDD
MYGFLLVCLTVLLVVYDMLIISLSQLLAYLYELSRKRRSISTIRLLSEWFYLFDKLLYKISPHLFQYSWPSDNVFKKSDKYSPIVLSRTLSALFISMVAVSPTNFVIWGTIAMYYFPTAPIASYNWLRQLSFDKVYLALTKFEYEKVNDFVSFSLFVLSLLILLRLSSSSFKWRAMMKVNEEKYEKVIRYQETIENELWKIRTGSYTNISELNLKISSLPNIYCQLVTKTDNYLFEDNKLKRKTKESWRHFQYKNIQDIYKGLESFQVPLQKINEVLKDISDLKVGYIYLRINKCVRYETIKLGLYRETHLDWELIEGDKFRKAIENRLEKISYLSDRFMKFKKINNGMLSKNEFVEEYNKYGGSVAYEDIVKYTESKLEEELINFKRFLHRALEEAIFSHTVLEQYLTLSHKNTRFSLLKIISNFITK